MKKTKTYLILLLVFVLLSGCAGLRTHEKEELRKLEAVGISKTDQKVKSVAAAGVLNLLPGIGNFYLAAGTEESSQWVFGGLNFVTWPLSIVWGVPQAAIDANTMNKKETVYYYKYSEFGKKEYQEAANRQRREFAQN